MHVWHLQPRALSDEGDARAPQPPRASGDSDSGSAGEWSGSSGDPMWASPRERGAEPPWAPGGAGGPRADAGCACAPLARAPRSAPRDRLPGRREGGGAGGSRPGSAQRLTAARAPAALLDVEAVPPGLPGPPPAPAAAVQPAALTPTPRASASPRAAPGPAAAAPPAAPAAPAAPQQPAAPEPPAARAPPAEAGRPAAPDAPAAVPARAAAALLGTRPRRLGAQKLTGRAKVPAQGASDRGRGGGSHPV